MSVDLNRLSQGARVTFSDLCEASLAHSTALHGTGAFLDETCYDVPLLELRAAGLVDFEIVSGLGYRWVWFTDDGYEAAYEQLDIDLLTP